MAETADMSGTSPASLGIEGGDGEYEAVSPEETQVLSKQLELGGVPITLPGVERSAEERFDRNWSKIAFFVPNKDIVEPFDKLNRYYSSASAKFTDTRCGCNIGVNSKPQWTRYCDIRAKGRMAGRNDVTLSNVSGNYGMGTAYSENLDDPAQKIFFRFGVVQYNTLTNFLLKAFNREQTILARTGRAPTAWYKLGNIVTAGLRTIAFPALTIAVWTAETASFLISRPTSKFFSIKPTMFFYWNTVNTLVINHSVNTGIIRRVMSEEDPKQRLGKPYTLDSDHMEILGQLYPDIFVNGTIDILAMATKAQRLANQQFAEDYAKLGNDTSTDMYGYLMKKYTTDGTGASYISNKKGNPSMMAWLNNILEAGNYSVAEEKAEYVQEVDPRVAGGMEQDADGKDTDVPKPISDHVESWKKNLDANMRDGAEWAIFRVDHTGTMQESFGNSVIESDLSQKLNGISSQTAEARFSFMDGNMVGGVIGTVVGAVKDIGLGALDAATFGFAGLAAGLGGSGYIDIPKHWQSANATLPRGSYKMKLISPYNNPISRLINIFIPLYMLMAGALPRSIGKQAYTSPYYCQIFDKGHLQARTAMIESISISRGTSNLQWDLSGNVLAIDVSVNVVDLSTIMHMPVGSGEMGSFDAGMDDDNILQDYLAVLAGMDIYSQIYTMPKAQIKATKVLANIKHSFGSPAYQAMMFKNSLTDGLLNDVTLGATGAIVGAMNAAVKGNALLEGTTRN